MLTGIELIDVPRTGSDGQVYMQSFCEAWKQAGGRYVRREGLAANKCWRAVCKWGRELRLVPRGHGRTYLVCARGGHLMKACMPYRGKFIPVLWDCWPDTWPVLERDLRLLGVETCFMTSRQVAERFSRLFPGRRFFYLPEGVSVSDYAPGPLLVEREGDVYELGRRWPAYHEALMRDGFAGRHKLIYNDDGRGKDGWAFPTFSAFAAGLRRWKITVSFPRSWTDAAARDVETLTIRYWEAMLSKCLVVGHCPGELEDLVGYNPVIEADMENPAAQLEAILSRIGDYQPLVERNYQAALDFAPWAKRVEQMVEQLGRHGAAHGWSMEED